MKQTGILSMLVLLALGASAQESPPSAEGSPAFIVFEETKSPDGRYAIAWGIKDRPDVRQYLNSVPRPEPDEFETDVENYIIDLHAQKIVATTGAHYWGEPDYGYANYQGLEVKWSADSEILVLLYSLRWEYGAFDAYRFVDGEVKSPMNLGHLMQVPFRQFLMKRYGSKYRAAEDEVVFFFDKLQGQDQFRYKVNALAQKIGDKGPDPFNGKGTLEFRLTKHGVGLNLRILGIKKQTP